MKRVDGRPGAGGRTSGGLVILPPEQPKPVSRRAVFPEEEVGRFRKIQAEYGMELDRLCEETALLLGEEAAGIFKAYKTILDDEEFFKEPVRRCREEGVGLDNAILEEQERVARLFAGMASEYLRERATDIKNVCCEIVMRLRGEKRRGRTLGREAIVAAEDLTPSETIGLGREYLKGIITENGDSTSHSVILARMMGIPAVIGARGIMEAARAASSAYIDGDEGYILLNPELREAAEDGKGDQGG